MPSSVVVNCPFFNSYSRYTVVCEGFYCAKYNTVSFAKVSDRDKFMFRYCASTEDSFKFTECPIYNQLMADYAEKERQS